MSRLKEIEYYLPLQPDYFAQIWEAKAIIEDQLVEMNSSRKIEQGSSDENRNISLWYATASLLYARALLKLDPEDYDGGRDFAEREILIWKKALKAVKKDDWSPISDALKEKGKGFASVLGATRPLGWALLDLSTIVTST